jgi:hypothetical protein
MAFCTSSSSATYTGAGGGGGEGNSILLRPGTTEREEMGEEALLSTTGVEGGGRGPERGVTSTEELEELAEEEEGVEVGSTGVYLRLLGAGGVRYEDILRKKK